MIIKLGEGFRRYQDGEPEGFAWVLLLHGGEKDDAALVEASGFVGPSYAGPGRPFTERPYVADYGESYAVVVQPYGVDI